MGSKMSEISADRGLGGFPTVVPVGEQRQAALDAHTEALRQDYGCNTDDLRRDYGCAYLLC